MTVKKKQFTKLSNTYCGNQSEIIFHSTGYNKGKCNRCMSYRAVHVITA